MRKCQWLLAVLILESVQTFADLKATHILKSLVIYIDVACLYTTKYKS